MRVLVVYKKSFLESHEADREVVDQLHAPVRAELLRADVENRKALADVTAFLEEQGVPYDAVFRGGLAARRRYDLVISVGGDGTFFAASHYVHDTPMFGINSDPSSSLGIWTCADRRTFREPLRLALLGKLKRTRLNRMKVSVNGRPLRELPLNDVLFAHRNPGAMTRYRMEADGRREEQKSSGLWIATAAGSTAGIRSAGGRRMPVTSKRLQYVVREPFGWPERRYRLARGEASRIVLFTRMMDAGIWIDGPRIHYALTLGDRVDIRTGAAPLGVLGYDDARRRRLFP